MTELKSIFPNFCSNNAPEIVFVFCAFATRCCNPAKNAEHEISTGDFSSYIRIFQKFFWGRKKSTLNFGKVGKAVFLAFRQRFQGVYLAEKVRKISDSRKSVSANVKFQTLHQLHSKVVPFGEVIYDVTNF